MKAADIIALADKVAAHRKSDNFLDVQCEIALFVPNEFELAIRPNSAATKVILTIHGGPDRTVRAADYTMSAGDREVTVALLRARAAEIGEA